MSQQVTVIAGPARSGKTTRLLCAYRQSISTGPLGGTLWLSPTYRAARAISHQLLDGSLPGCFSPQLLTFDQLGQRILAASAPPLHAISRQQVRSTLRQLIDEALTAGRLEYFAPIAETAGFLDLLVKFVRELKRLEIWPEELAAAQGHRATEKDRELCGLYRDYQNLLNAHHLYDAEGQFWVARQLLREGHWDALPSVRHVLVDGFTDFTRTEHEVLELLAARAESLAITLPCEAGDGRSDLFDKVRRTLSELRERHSGLCVEQLPPRSDLPAALVHLERGLFGNPRAAQPVPDGAGIEILAAAGATNEIEQIAARIKGLLTNDDPAGRVAADEILVVFRSLAEVAPLVREIFARFGIPTVVASASALETAPLARALVTWLRLDRDDWPFRELLAALEHNYFRPRWPEWQGGSAAVWLERLVRELEIPTGRQALLASIGWHESKAAEAARQKKRLSNRQLAAQIAGPLACRIAGVLDQLPKQATCGEWSRALNGLAEELGLFRAAQPDPLGGDRAVQDRLAWQRLQAALAETDRFARWIGAPAAVLSRREFCDRLQDLLRTEELPLAGDDTGCVRVLSAESVRGLSAAYVFVAGMSERAFPPPNRDDCVYSDADARRWGAHGLPLPSHELRSRFEMLLFYEVVTRATRHLVLSYPALDGAAQPLVPSPYLSEVEHACGAGRILRNAQPYLASVPANDEVGSVRDFRVRAVAQALQGDDGLLVELCAHPSTRPMAANILAGLSVSDARFRGEGFGPYEGLLSSAASAKLAERYGPQRCWSPSQLEQYAYCPFQFFMKSVLRLDAVAEPELGIDYLRRGQMLHWLLSKVHREFNRALGTHSAPDERTTERFAALVVAAVEELRGHGSGDALDGGLREIDIRKIVAWLERYRQQHAAYNGLWADWHGPPRPAHFEVAFGPRHRDDDTVDPEELADDCDPLSTLDPFELACGDEIIRFAGRIDRIDLGQVAGQRVFTIVDYKSGKVRKSTSLQAVLEGRSFQLPLYALAAQRLLASAPAAPFRAAYWHLSGSGYVEKHAVKIHVADAGRLEISDEWQELEATLKPRLRSLVDGIRSGQFPMHSVDDECTSFCDYSTVCRVNQVRSLEKHWEPPAAETP